MLDILPHVVDKLVLVTLKEMKTDNLDCTMFQQNSVRPTNYFAMKNNFFSPKINLIKAINYVKHV